MLDIDNIRIDGGTQARVELNESVVSDYAEILESGETLPPVVVFFDGVDHWLADGFHRYFAHKKIDAVEISADIRDGTRRDAVLYSVGANKGHGLQASRADKRKGAETLLKDAEWSKWSDREIAKKCGLSATTIGTIRSSLSKLDSDKEVERTYTTKHGTTAVMKTASIGRQAAPVTPVAQAAEIAQLSDGEQVAAIAKPMPKAAPEPSLIQAPPAVPEASDDYTELDSARDQISELQIEVARLSDRLAIECYDVSEEAKTEASRIITELRAEVQSLNAQLAAVTLSRDTYMEENAQMKAQMKMQRREIEKLKSKD